MDLDRIVAELKSEQDRIWRTINAVLEGVGVTGPITRSVNKAVASADLPATREEMRTRSFELIPLNAA